ncbi:MAG: hypothetical protein KDD96_03170 [Rhodobacteraceae bacterium]|nr:hypothetical protein [Paracoccaceae bacterium]
MRPTENEAVDFCEASIQRQVRYCREHGVFPKWPEIADRLMKRRLELRSAYVDLFRALEGLPRAADVFFDAILCAISVWDPQKITKMRAARKRHAELRTKVMDLARELGNCLGELSEIENSTPVISSGPYHIVDMIEQAARNNYSFQGHVKDGLRALRSEYDMKYWPRLSEIAFAISQSADDAVLALSDPVSAAALSSPRASQADFCKALMQRVEACIQNGTNTLQAGRLPHGFHLKDESWASLVNCLLDLGPDEIIAGDYMKRMRQRAREKANPGT